MKTMMAVLVMGATVALATSAHATLIKVDFGADIGGYNSDWDRVGGTYPPGTNWELTDWSGDGDDDVILEYVSGGSNISWGESGPPITPAIKTYEGVDVPIDYVRSDYLYAVMGSGNFHFRFANLDPGNYNVTVFEGRTTDGSQSGKIWADNLLNTNGNEPVSNNTGNYAGDGYQTIGVTVDGTNSCIWFMHSEDDTGGTSGIIISRAIPEPASLGLLAIGGLMLISRRRRA